MGQQQLLLIILGIIVVGIAIAVGMGLFRADSVSHKRDLLLNETSSLATLAMAYYKKPANLGGGGNTFTGWSIPEQMKITGSGSFSAAVFKDSVVITGVGNEVVTGTDSIKVTTTVLKNNYYSQIIN